MEAEKEAIKRLALNVNIYPLLRTKYGFGLSVLPLGFMMLAIFVIAGLEELLFDGFGIFSTPATDEFKLSTTSSGIVLVGFMIAGCIIGWSINKLVAQTIFGWEKYKIERVFLYSEVPISWFKPNGAAAYKSELKEATEFWAHRRLKGPAYVSFLTGGLLCAGLLFIVYIFNPFLNGVGRPELLYIAWPGVLYAAGCSLFGYLIWYFSEREFINNQKYLKESQYINSLAEEPVPAQDENSLNDESLPTEKMSVLTLIHAMLFPIMSLTLGFGLLYLSMTDTKEQFPEYDSLIEIHGQVDWVEWGKDELHFGLKNNESRFKYPNKAHGKDKVYNKLHNAEDQIASIRVRLISEDLEKPLYDVFEIKVAGQQVRSYQEIESGWSNFSLLTISMWVLFILFGGYLSWQIIGNFVRSRK